MAWRAARAAPVVRLALAACLFCMELEQAGAAYDNLPVRSTNVNGSQPVEFYVAPDIAAYGLVDPHPVHGVLLSDGGYVMAGKALESETAGAARRAFAVKLNATGSIMWVWSSTTAGSSAVANAVLQLPDGGGELIVVGYRTLGGVAQRTITQLSLGSGVEAWTAAWPSSNPSLHGAWEMADLSADASMVLLAGLTDSLDSSHFAFKSYGNVGGGSAIVQALPIASLAGLSPPLETAATWTYGPNSDFYTSKAARALADGSVVALLYGEFNGRMASLVKLSGTTGALLWGPNDFGPQHGEGSDVVVSANGTGFAISGHGDGGIAGTLSGRLTKVNADGTHAWSRSYSSIDYSLGGSTRVIKNECWGLQPTSDGYVMGCGTGIENCDGETGTVLADCNRGTVDPRPGAHARLAGVWLSMLVRTDLDGNLRWLRSDQHRQDGKPKLGDPGWETVSSASEYVIVTPDGGITSINDEAGGIGLLRLAPVNGTNASAAGLSDDETAQGNASQTANRNLPLFHPCAGALNGPIVDRIRDAQRYLGSYTSQIVVALSPRIGPVSGGVSVGVCGLGFTQANEGVSHVACRFTDGRYSIDVPAVYVDEFHLRCTTPDFTRFAVGMPHNVSVEVSTSRGGSWTNNRVPFTYYSTRPAIDAFGRPIWGYEPTFTKSAWQVTFEQNEFGAFAHELYPPSGHPRNDGRPSPWDAARDPFHAQGDSAAWQPVELDVGDRMEPASDLVMRTAQAKMHGVEGSWGDRKSFLRAHALVPDVYRKDVVAARAAAREAARAPGMNNGEI